MNVAGDIEHKVELNYIIDTLKELKSRYRYISIGLAGSYLKGSNTSESDVDVILDANDSVVEDLEVNTDIYNFLYNKLGKEIDMVWVSLLKKSSDMSDELAKELGVDIDGNTPYRSIMRDVMWID